MLLKNKWIKEVLEKLKYCEINENEKKYLGLFLTSLQIPKEGNTKEYSNYYTIALISHDSKVMLKILQARLQQYVNCELPDVQTGFRKGRGARDQIANIHWIIKKAREVQKGICFIDFSKAFDCDFPQQTVENSVRDGNARPHYLPPEKSVCMSRSNS